MGSEEKAVNSGILVFYIVAQEISALPKNVRGHFEKGFGEILPITVGSSSWTGQSTKVIQLYKLTIAST